jgi:PTH1 family peptidyl-tRNA hydrolase
MWLIVGLGNPGAEYASHRHNVGFMLVDELARELGADPFRAKFSGEIAKARAGAEEILLLKPQTFMNRSGQSVQPAAAFLDVPFAELRLKVGGGHAGHNGLRSIIQSLGSPEFVRLRMGIGRPPAGFRGDVADFVLSGFSMDERIALSDVLSRARASVLEVLARGVTPAMNKLNTKPSSKSQA